MPQPLEDGAPVPLYGRVLLKVSGEALMGAGGYGIEPKATAAVAAEVAAVHAAGVRVAMVIGGGNIFRGVSAAARGMERATADYMGMLATVMNALAVQAALEARGVPARVLSAIPMRTVCEPFIRRRALRHMEKRRVVLFAAGTGNPYFTTDTGAALRASEMGCDVLMKATKVDGIYDQDPMGNPDAKRYNSLSYRQVLSDNLRVMDAAAVALCRDGNIPIVVFRLQDEGAFNRVARGQGSFTRVGGVE